MIIQKQYFVVLSWVTLVTSSSVYISNDIFSKIIELKDKSQPCVIHTESNTVRKMLKNSKGKYLQTMPTRDWNTLAQSCSNEQEFNLKGGFFFPGTKWCGPGNIAQFYNDLGPLSEEDRCCRDHDHCPNQIEPGQCRKGICNITPFTRSACYCDENFKQCLRQVNSDAANTIATLYFNVAQVVCFKERRQCPLHMRHCDQMSLHVHSPYSRLNSAKEYFNRRHEEFASRLVNNFFKEFLRPS